jgi:hypothetical protein
MCFLFLLGLRAAHYWIQPGTSKENRRTERRIMVCVLISVACAMVYYFKPNDFVKLAFGGVGILSLVLILLWTLMNPLVSLPCDSCSCPPKCNCDCSCWTCPASQDDNQATRRQYDEALLTDNSETVTINHPNSPSVKTSRSSSIGNGTGEETKRADLGSPKYIVY